MRCQLKHGTLTNLFDVHSYIFNPVGLGQCRQDFPNSYFQTIKKNGACFHVVLSTGLFHLPRYIGQPFDTEISTHSLKGMGMGVQQPNSLKV